MSSFVGAEGRFKAKLDSARLGCTN